MPPSSTSRRLSAILLGGLLGSGAGEGWAAPPRGPVRRAIEARRACDAGRVEEGVELLARILSDTGNTNAVYNQARCYQANGRSHEALARFREYLRIANDLLPRERARVRRFVDELEREIAARPLPPAAPPAAPSLPAALDAAGDPTPLPAPGQLAGDSEEDRGTRLRAARQWQLAAGGVAAASLLPVALGFYFGQQAERIKRQIEGQTQPITFIELETRWRRGERAATGRDITLAIGGAMLAGAGALYLFGRPRSEVRIAIGPGGALLEGHF